MHRHSEISRDIPAQAAVRRSGARLARRAGVGLASGLLVGLPACSSDTPTTTTPAVTLSAPSTLVPSTPAPLTSAPLTTGPATPPPAGTVPVPAEPITIVIKDFTYKVPASIPAGASVNVENEDSEAHTVTAPGTAGLDVNVKGTASALFNAPAQAGRYPIVCRFHGNMKTTLVIG